MAISGEYLLTITASRDRKLESRLIAPSELEVTAVLAGFAIPTRQIHEIIVKDEPRAVGRANVLGLNLYIEAFFRLIVDLKD